MAASQGPARRLDVPSDGALGTLRVVRRQRGDDLGVLRDVGLVALRAARSRRSCGTLLQSMVGNADQSWASVRIRNERRLAEKIA